MTGSGAGARYLATWELGRIRGPAVAIDVVRAFTTAASGTGMVRTDGASKADKRRALKRAQAVRNYLQKLGITGEITTSNKGRTQSTTGKARRVNVTITYVT